jgi:hypothetical protein
MDSRIYFKNNPWPEGHLLKNFVWEAEVKNGDVWFNFHLETTDYYSERDIDDEDEIEYESDWKAPIVWGNYHSCTLSSNEWHNGGFKICSLKDYSQDFLDGLEIEVDSNPEQIEDWENLAFHIYLLGHDAVAKHKIKFIRTGKSTFDISWCGKIAQAYVGDYEFKHDFHTTIKSVKEPFLNRDV